VSEDAADIPALAQDAVIWGLPLVMMGRYLQAAESGAAPFNRLFMNTDIATPQSHAVGPNIDTLNGRAWLDLSGEPQVIGVPATADRYYCIQLQDMYMNSFAYLGRRTTGTKAGAFAVTPPGWRGVPPPGVTEVRATSDKVLLMVRTLVRGPDDLPAVREINGAFRLGPLSAYPDGLGRPTLAAGAIDAFQPPSRRDSRRLPHQALAAAGAGYFHELDQLVRRFPPRVEDAPNLARFSPLGVGPAARTRAVDDAVLGAAVPAGVELAQNALESFWENGWSRRPNVEAFIEAPLQRAANNIFGPNTQIALESVFFNMRKGPDAQALSGANRYRLRFPRDETPPVDGFWSLTLYDGAYVLFDNPLDRYGVTDRTPGLRYDADGALEIQIQVDEPEAGPSNWLPAPRDTFQLVLRTYQPRQPVLDRTWRPPRLEIVGAAG
jgi:hypothetical protein